MSTTVSDSSSAQNAIQRVKDSYDADRAQNEENHDAQIKKLKEEYETNIEASRKETNQRIASEREAAREEIQKLRDELYDSKGQKSAKEGVDEQTSRRDFNRYKSEVDRDASRRVKDAEEYADTRITAADKRTGIKVEDAVSAQKKSDSQQVKELRDEVSIYRAEGRDTYSTQAKAKEQTINAFEKEKLDERSRIVDSYERAIARMKDHESELEDRTSRKIADISLTANEKAKQIVREQLAEFKHQSRNQEVDHSYHDATLKNELKAEQLRNQMGQDHLIQKHADETVQLAKSKDQAYGSYIAKNSEKTNYEISSRDAKIRELSTNDDPLKASVAVVSKVHETEAKRFNDQLNEVQAGISKNLTAEQVRDASERRELRDQFNAKVMDVNRSKQRAVDVQTKKFNEAYQDLQDQSVAKINTVSNQAQKNAEHVYQQGNFNLTAAQIQNKEALEAQRETLTHDKINAVDDLEQMKKIQDREWAMKFSDLRRGYEAKIVDAHDEHEKAISELRLDYDKKLRDLDRTSKRTLDDRVRAYEYQIRQQELGFKERERFLNEHYQEELDTMKRTNAYLIQKKS